MSKDSRRNPVLQSTLIWSAGMAMSFGALYQSQPSLQRELRIDGSAQNLVTVNWIAVGRDGRIAAAQAQDRAIVFFDSAGRPIGKFGGRGDGPGEFQSIGTAGFTGDSLWVYDLLGRRTTVFGPNLALLRTFSIAAVQPAPGAAGGLPTSRTFTPAAFFPDGSLLVRASVGGNNPAPPGFDTTGFPLFRVSQTGVIQRYVAHVTPFPDRTVNSRVGDISIAMSVPYLAASIFKVSSRGNRIAVLTAVYTGANANTMRLVLYGNNGDTIFVRNYPFEGERIPAATAENAVAQMVANMGRSLGGGSVPPEAREEMRRRIPPVYAPYTDMLVGDDGAVWIGLRSEANVPRPYMLLDPRGNPAGRLTIPANTSPLAVSATHMWGVERDSLDVPSIVRYRVARQ